jgi:hypothetical protein
MVTFPRLFVYYPLSLETKSWPVFEVNSFGLIGDNETSFKFNDNRPINISLTSQSKLMLMPMEEYQKMLDFLNIKVNNSYDRASIPCDTQLEFKFTFESEELIFYGKDLLQQKDDETPGNCFLETGGIEAYPEMDPIYKQFWSIGTALTVNYCALYDMSKSTIGFAKIKDTSH